MAGGYYSSSSRSEPCLPLHLCFFLCILLMFVGFSWYSNYESVIESALDQIKLVLMLSPLVLLLAVHLLANVETGARRAGFSTFIPLPQRDSLHRAGGTPWGVGFLLVLLFFMISYQSALQERWFPLLSK
ncbi:Small heat shock protein HSP [Trema orientale]|uniref:Small heat shock protein HSP n=1 Tax=Trema orientale TaxID=63057 RepID=A0A2P5BUC7_TREOI|nr:Small heat shock protein HSP [Trema orientale]